MIIYNYVGIVIFALAFGVAIGIGELLGVEDEGPLMMIGGPLVVALDLAYRFSTKDGHWIIPHRGGSLFFAPAWCLGVLWLVLGAVYAAG